MLKKLLQKIKLSNSFDPNENFLDLKIVRKVIIIPSLIALIIALLVGTPVIIKFIINFVDTGNFYAIFNSQNWNQLVFTTLRLPVSILVALIPIIALLAAAHRSEQTKTQIAKTNIQIEKTNIQMKQNEYFKGLDNLAEDSLRKIEVSVRQLTALKNLTAEQKEAIKIAFIQRLKNPLTKIIETNNTNIEDKQFAKIVFFNYGELILDWLTTNGNIKNNELDKTNFDYQKLTNYHQQSSENTNLSVLKKQSHSHLSFVRARLYNVDLSGAYLYDAKLSGADLRNSNLYDAKLSGADLRKADLRDTDLRKASLSGANLSGAYLNKAKLQEVWLDGTDFSNADLSGANLLEAKFQEAKQEAKFEGANLTGTKIKAVDLKNNNPQLIDEQKQQIIEE